MAKLGAFILKNSLAALCLLLVVLALTRWFTGGWGEAFALFRGEELWLEQSSFDVGDISYEEKVSVEVKLSNLTGNPFEIQGAEKSCGCLTVDEFPLTVPGFSTICLSLVVGEPLAASRFQHEVVFFTNSTQTPTFRIGVTGFSQREVSDQGGPVLPMPDPISGSTSK